MGHAIAPASDADRGAEAEWRRAVAGVLKGADFANLLIARSRDGIALGPLFGKAEPASPRPWRDGAVPVGVIQRIDHPDPAEANLLARAEVENGATGLILTFADASTARGFGLSADTPDAIATILEGVVLDGLDLRCEFPSSGATRLVDCLAGGVERLGYRLEHLVIDVGADPISAIALATRAPVDTSPDAVAAEIGDWLECLDSQGLRPALRVDGRPHHEAGASEAQELAAVLSSGVAYLRAAEVLGTDPGRLSLGFTLAADADQTLTIAKFRAFRRLWARVGQVCGLAPGPVRLRGETTWRMLTCTDPWSNVVRSTIACAGAILGGADCVTVLPFTSALGLPDAFARRLARNTARVLLDETQLDRVADPSAGSGTFDGVTDALCHHAWRLFQELEAGGGLVAALADGGWQARVAATRDARRADIAVGKACIVGVTAFGDGSDIAPAVLRSAAPAAPEKQMDRPGEVWVALRSCRDAEAFEQGRATSARVGGNAP